MKPFLVGFDLYWVQGKITAANISCPRSLRFNHSLWSSYSVRWDSPQG